MVRARFADGSLHNFQNVSSFAFANRKINFVRKHIYLFVFVWKFLNIKKTINYHSTRIIKKGRDWYCCRSLDSDINLNPILSSTLKKSFSRFGLFTCLIFIRNISIWEIFHSVIHFFPLLFNGDSLLPRQRFYFPLTNLFEIF